MPRQPLLVFHLGASVAGPTAAYWQPAGIAVTVVERMLLARVRTSRAVDLLGPAMDVAEWTGVLPAVMDAGTGPRLSRSNGTMGEVSTSRCAAWSRIISGPARRGHAQRAGRHPLWRHEAT
jgi:2-polyprenyl-6-methoxyphenol hydroxylase-like FAD-dependent oxidoreductase